MQISVIDVGATTVNLLRASVQDGLLLKWCDTSRFVRGGEQTLTSGTIAEPAWQSTMNAVRVLTQRARQRSHDSLVAVATSIVREASNGSALRNAIVKGLGLEVQVPTPAMEARLAHRGACSAHDLASTESVVVVDLGGGCVNFAIGSTGGEVVTSMLPIGHLRLAPAFMPGETLSRDDAQALAALVGRTLGKIVHQADVTNPSTLVFTSGAACAVRALAMHGDTYCGRNGGLGREELRKLQNEVVSCRRSDLVRRGVVPERAPSFPVAVVLMRAIMDTLGFSTARVSDRGLREGVALAYFDAAVGRGEPVAGIAEVAEAAK